MTATATALVFAVLAQITWTILVGFWLGWTRHVAVRDRTITGDVMCADDGWPKPARLAQRNFANQFEVPVLFYALSLLALFLHAAGLALAILAWIFVASRIAHSFAHCGPNDLRLRGPAFFVGVIVVMIMIVLLAATVAAA
ncbi:hypothetical protein EYW49_06075 [Siculibacillus lacustris]|uniref:MAPEG family protein n=1 Tax=Siculibacillus lacustris TaxID=1549641 RepID=A0A4Q9VUK1_9HYPH|nr:MAPEG family protein [Siculibacillus lacustris]TBW39823.1 hypothetical protein EYW49_06075 [Siculibacillus lacustris]